jgi:GT2 family glycosyltransferase
MASISVIVVNYNGRDFLGELLLSLERQSRRANQVIVVDNASTDGSASYVRQRFPWVTLIESPANTGFAGGNNIGFACADGDYVALLNSDTTLDPDWLAELERVLDADDRVGAAVSKIYLGKDRAVIDCAGAQFNNLGFCWGRGSNQDDCGQFDEAGQVAAVTACAMMLRREALAGRPLFDQQFYLYYEEFDLTIRLRGQGYTIVYVPSAVVYHHRSRSLKQLSTEPSLIHQFYTNRNRVKILAKYYPASLLLRNSVLILLSLAYCDWVFLRNGQGRLFVRAVVGQARYALLGLIERFRGEAVKADVWLPWMTQQSLREILALRSELGAYVK